MPPVAATHMDLLPEEMLERLLAPLGSVELCVLAQTCGRFRSLVTCGIEPLWATLYHRRWIFPTPPPLVDKNSNQSWRLRYAQRHTQDAQVVPLLRQLLSRPSRKAAWRRLLDLGEEIYERVLEVADTEPMDLRAADLPVQQFASTPVSSTSSLSSEAWKTLRAINQTLVRKEWESLQRGPAGCTPFVEDGALLLVRFYTCGQDLRTPYEKADHVKAEIAAMAARLAARLHEQYDAVAAVRELAQMLFVEEGFSGNQQNYYDHRNSLLDHVITSHTGIPISLSVLFAAVCRRVGVHLDMIGLPGHFLLATRPQAPSEPRVFVDAFHGGAMLGLEQCEQIVRSYGIRWSEEMATPVQVGEVWDRMVRNLLNCHKQTGDMAQARVVQGLLPRESVAGAAPPLPYPSGSPSEYEEHTQASPAVLMQMLQNMLQMQQQT